MITDTTRRSAVLVAALLLSMILNEIHAVGVQIFTSDNDLSSTLIKQVFIDSDGFLWVATESGLNRYDGSKITVYKRNSNDAASLAHDYVNSLFEDSRGNIYVASHSGVQVYDKLNDNFSVRATAADGTPFNESVRTVLEMADGRIISLGTSVYELVHGDNTLTVKPLPYTDKINNVTTAIADSRGNLWLSYEGKGIVKVGKDNSLKTYLGGVVSEVPVLAVSDGGTLYAADTSGGFYVYNMATDTFDRIDDSLLNGVRISDLRVDEAGNVFIGTDGAGLYVYRPATRSISRVALPLWHDTALKIHSMAKDSYNNLWFGLYQKGVLMLPARDSGFNSIDQRSGKNVYIGQACVTTMLREPDGSLWIGTDNDGVYRLSPDFKESRHYIDGVPRVVMRLFQDSAGNLWVGTYGQGMGILSADGTYRRVPLNTVDGRPSEHVFGFVEVPDGSIWIATMGDGLFRYDPATRSARHMADLNDKVNRWISDICYSERDRHLYLGTYDGFYKLDPNTLGVDVLTRGMIVTSVFEDRDDHNFWLATPSGLALSANGNIVGHVFTTDDGLPSNTVYAIEKSGNSLWLSTNNGLSQLNLENNTFVNYDINEGLQSNEFFKNSSTTDTHGNLYFGGINGFTYFNPDNITSSGKKLDLRITDFYVGGVSARNGMLSGGRRVIDEPVYKARTFYLANEDNSFSVEFATKQMANSSLTDFYYAFDNENWEKMPKNNRRANSAEGNIITFSNIKSGRHTLRIKAVDNGVESDILTVDIVVAAPWFASWWAWLLYTLALVAVVYVLWRHRRRRAHRLQHEMEQKHDNDIREAKLQFFTNISHEIRTPLTLVISPVQKLLSEDTEPGRQKMYRTILRNSQRIHKLVDELMDLRKIDNKQMRLRYREVNITGFVNDLYNTFLPAANNKGIELTYAHEDCDTLNAWVDPGNFDKIVMNLLSNAIKFTPKGGYVKIILTRGRHPGIDGPLREYFRLEVIDSGMGISEDDRRHIFERFYQSNNNKIGGTGIGLHLTHSLVQMHRGTILVTDNPLGKGTCFTVEMPVGREHLSDADIDPSTDSTYIGKDVMEMNSIVADQSVVPEPEKSAAPASRSLVYIADDDNEVRNYLVQTMSEKYRVEAFANGVEALEAMHRQVPDLIITDVMMPQMDGITLAEKVRQNVNFNHIPIIMLSAKNREEDTIEGLDTGADAYITKPFNIDILMRTARNLLENRQLLRNVYSGNQNLAHKVDEIKVQSSDEKLLERIMKVVNKNISNPNITVETIAQEIGISRVHLHRKLKELTNQSTRDFIRNIRLQQAAKMLREKKLSVAEVSDLVGFKHPNNFSTNFKEMFGMSPSAYADQHHGGS